MFRFFKCIGITLITVVLFTSLSETPAKENYRLVEPELLKKTELKILWQNKLPLKKGEGLNKLYLLDRYIYALSDRNFLAGLSKNKGNMLFGRNIAPEGLPIHGMNRYDNELLITAGGNIVEIDPEFGTEIKSKTPDFNLALPVVRNENRFFAAGTNGRLRVLRAKDKTKLFEISAQNESGITSVIAGEGFAVFSTDAGNIISIAADSGKKLWQFDADGGVVGPMTTNGDSLFFANKDSYVYKLDINSGKLLWKYQTAAILENAPRPAEKGVYQYVHDNGLTAINNETGKKMWQLAEGADLLTESGDRAYVITQSGRLVVMSNKKNKKLYSVDFTGISKHIANAEDGRIYIADDSGRIACLEPID